MVGIYRHGEFASLRRADDPMKSFRLFIPSFDNLPSALSVCCVCQMHRFECCAQNSPCYACAVSHAELPIVRRRRIRLLKHEMHGNHLILLPSLEPSFAGAGRHWTNRSRSVREESQYSFHYQGHNSLSSLTGLLFKEKRNVIMLSRQIGVVKTQERPVIRIRLALQGHPRQWELGID